MRDQLLAIALISPIAAAASAATLVLDEPLGNAPQAGEVDVVCDELGGNTIRLAITADLSRAKFVRGVFFNLDPSLDPDLLTADYSSGQLAADFVTGRDEQHVPIAGFFDFAFVYDTSNGRNADRFVSDETSTYTLSYGGDAIFDCGSLQFLSVPQGSHDPVVIAARTGGGGGVGVALAATSPVPEPASLGLLLPAIAPVLLRRKRSA